MSDVHQAADEASRAHSGQAAPNALLAGGSAEIVRLLRLILKRLPDPNAPLGEAIEWETEDGLYRTTDKKMAENWAPNIGVRVIRRAQPVASSALHDSASTVNAEGTDPRGAAE